MTKKKLDSLTATVMQDFAHVHSVTIQSRRRVLQTDLDETDRAIVALSSEVARQRERRAKLVAMIEGLTAVVAKR